MNIEVITSILLLVAGVGVFIVACNMLSTNIEAVSSTKLKAMFSKASKNKLVGVGIGTTTTAVIQSSAATIVLVIGFVNAGIMGLPLAASIIYGANIGTTITAWIASLSTVGESISLTVIFGALAGIGASLSLLAKKDSTKAKLGIFTALGLVFMGLWIMSGSMSGLADSEGVRDFISSLDNIFLLVFIGFLITGITQSSSVTTAILISMLPVGAATGLITLEQAIYMTLGANIGSCIIVLVSGFTGCLNAKRAALLHLFFNLFGTSVFIIAGFVMGIWGFTYSDFFSNIFDGYAAMQMASFHTVFNVVTAGIMIPLTGKMLALITRILPDTIEKEEGCAPRFYCIDRLMLRNPPVAVQQLKNEIINMAKIAMTNFRLSVDMVRTLDMTEKERFTKNEDELDYLAWEMSKFLMELGKLKLTYKDRLFVSSAYHNITDLERIGDYAENMMEYADKLIAMEKHFSSTAREEINGMEALIESLYSKVMEAYESINLLSLEQAFEIEEKIDDYTTMMTENHIVRLNSGNCTLNAGAVYLSLSSDAERIADHLMNVGKSIRTIA